MVIHPAAGFVNQCDRPAVVVLVDGKAFIFPRSCGFSVGDDHEDVITLYVGGVTESDVNQAVFRVWDAAWTAPVTCGVVK